MGRRRGLPRLQKEAEGRKENGWPVKDSDPPRNGAGRIVTSAADSKHRHLKLN